MFLNSIEIYNFRNIKQQKISFDHPVSVFSGRNGQGKTSIIESIFVLAHAKSFRTSSIRDLVGWVDKNVSVVEENPIKNDYFPDCRILADLVTSSGSRQIVFEVCSGKRRVLVNGKKADKASNFFGKMTVVEFTPDELELVKGQPLVRRQFIDRTLAMVDGTYIDSLVKYHRALKSRNSILKGLEYRPVHLTHELNSWVPLLIKYGQIITQKRLEFLQFIRGVFSNYYKLLSDLSTASKEIVDFDYQSDFVSTNRIKSEQELNSDYLDRERQDIVRRKTSLGIHRDDMLLFIDVGFGNKLARKSCSQGQARTISLALKLTAADFISKASGETPIILLDDIESELDEYRCRALYEILSGFKSQVLITTTEISPTLRNILKNSSFFDIFAGEVTRLRHM